MGIDVYLEWDGMPERPDTNDYGSPEMKAYLKFRYETSGTYLREAYHGGPYATEFLFREAWKRGKNAAQGTAMVKALATMLKDTGKLTKIEPELPDIPEGLDTPVEKLPRSRKVRKVSYTDSDGKREALSYPSEVLRQRLPQTLQIAVARGMKLYNLSAGDAAKEAMEFEEFVQQHELLEKAGKNPRVHVSA